jgi:hypothetical protein
MRPFTRICGAIVLALSLAMGLATATPAVAQAPAAESARLDRFCSALSEAIEFLESRPPSRLRDALLEHARNLFARYCS